MDKQNEKNSLKPSAIILFSIAVGVFSLVSALNPLGIFGLPLAIFAGALATLLMSRQSVRTSLAALIPALAAYAAALALLHSPILALAALFPIFLALPIVLSLSLKQQRSGTIALTALAVTIFWLLYFALSIFEEAGAIDISSINQTLDEAFMPIRERLAELTYEAGGETYPYYAQNTIDTMIYQVKTVLIGSLAAAMIVVAYLTTLVIRVVANVFGVSDLLPCGVRLRVHAVVSPDGPEIKLDRESVQWYIRIDNITAIFFIAAYLLSVLTAGADSSMLSIAADNLMLILLPGFVYVGVREIALGMREGSGAARFGCVISLLSLVLLFINPMTVLMLLSIVGVTSTIKENRRSKLINESRKD